MTDHERIWLEPAPGADEEYGRQWCQNNVWGDDATEYMLAELVNQTLEDAQHDAVSAETELRIVRKHLEANQQADDGAAERWKQRYLLISQQERDAQQVIETLRAALKDVLRHMPDYPDTSWQNAADVLDALSDNGEAS